MAVSCSTKSSSIDLKGTWNIESAYGVSTEGAETPAFISFEETEFNGNASVNNFFGSYTFEEGGLALNNVGMTRKMGASMEIEDAITKALNNCSSVKMEGEKLVICDNDGNDIMVLSK